MNVFKRLVFSIRIMEPIYLLCGGVGMGVLGCVTLMSSSCHVIYSLLLLPRGALPFWMFAFLGVCLFVLYGVCAGCVFAGPCSCKRAYSQCLLALLCAVVLMLWYHVLFRSLSVFLAFLLTILLIALQLLTVIKSIGDNIVMALGMTVAMILSLHIFWLNIGILFLN